MRNYHKPMRRPGDVIESWTGDGDPAQLASLAHDTAAALLHRVRETPDPAIFDRVISYADQHGIDDVAELWSSADPNTLPGALWRIYVLRHQVRDDPDRTGYAFRRGLELDGVNEAIVGSPHAPGPDEVVELATQILRGAFTGDFAVALERAAAFCRILAAGSHDLASLDPGSLRAEENRADADHHDTVAAQLTTAARLWRADKLH